VPGLRFAGGVVPYVDRSDPTSVADVRTFPAGDLAQT
jgi:hypothetical protein